MLYRVEGFTFETEEEARLAGKEAEGVRYIQAQNNIKDPDVALKLYNRLVEKKIFTTPVGISFLGEMRSLLLKVPYIRQSELLPLPAYRKLSKAGSAGERGGRRKPGREPSSGPGEVTSDVGREPSATAGAVQVPHAAAGQNSLHSRRRDYRKPFLISTFFAVVFAAVIVGIYIITALSADNVTILNYENQLIDRYESWEQDLTRREEALRREERKQKEQEQRAQEESHGQTENSGGG